MTEVRPLVRLQADNNGETKCVVLSYSFSQAKKGLKPYVSSIVKSYPFISAFGAYINVHNIRDIEGLPFVKTVTANSMVHASMEQTRKLTGVDRLHDTDCFGEGVGIAVIDTGISPHLDFCMPRYRIAHFEDFINGYQAPYDDNGHGTAVTSILAGNGLYSFGKFKGVAPKTNIISLKAMNSAGEGSAFNILAAMQWIFTNRVKYNIKVVCMSFGTKPQSIDDPLVLGAEALHNSGITVVASAGNSGPDKGTITSPGVSPRIITVGGVGIDKDNHIFVADFSSRGPANGLIKPDLVAPAVGINCCKNSGGYTSYSGTSMSTPVVAGLCAEILSKNPSYTPDKVKEVLISRARSLNFSQFDCGYGLANLTNLSNH